MGQSMNTTGVPGFDDTFFGPNDKKYADRLTRDMVRLRGQNLVYYKKQDAPARIDGDRPLSSNPDLGPFDTKRHSGSEGAAALYGEPVRLYTELNPYTKELAPDWNYSSPFDVRGVLFSSQQTDVPDERGHVENRKLMLNLSRAMCDDIKLVPEIGDIVKVPVDLKGLYDVALVTTDSHRFGGTGFFTAYDLVLTKTSKYEPQRKNLPDREIEGG